MEAIKTKFAGMERFTKPTTKANSHRAELVEQFLTRLNPSRVEAGYKALTPARLGMMLAHVQTDDLHAFYKSCEGYKGGFSRCFFGSLKKK